MAALMTIDSEVKRSNKKLAKKIMRVEKRLFEKENISISKESTKVWIIN